MNVSTLGDAADFVNGYAFKPSHWSDRGLKIVRIQNLTDDTKFFNRTELEPGDRYVVRPGDLLVSWSATLGVFSWTQEPALVNQHIFKVVPKAGVDRHFLRHVIGKALQDMVRHLHGATMKHVNRGDFLSTPIPLPPLPEQKRIAAILDKADAIRRKRAETIRLADDFLKSTFLDMFGDPVTNPRGWPLSKLEGLGEVQGGLQVSGRRAHDGIEVPYLRVANVYRDALDLTEIKTIMVTRNELERTTLQKGDVLVVEGHGNRDEIGRSAVWDGSINPCVHQNHLIRVRALKGTTPEYLSAFLNSAGGRRQMFRAGRTTSGLNTISTSTVRNILMLAPPPKLQTHYSKVVAQVARSKMNMQTHERVCAEQFHALSQNAFQGDL